MNRSVNTFLTGTQHSQESTPAPSLQEQNVPNVVNDNVSVPAVAEGTIPYNN